MSDLLIYAPVKVQRNVATGYCLITDARNRPIVRVATEPMATLLATCINYALDEETENGETA